VLLCVGRRHSLSAALSLSSLELIVVSPLGGRGQYPPIGDAVVGVSLHLQELVSGLEQAAVLGAAITDDDLR